MSDSIIVFAKAPVLGKVKTRLMNSSNEHSISAEEALVIHTAFLTDTLHFVHQIGLTRSFLYYTLNEGEKIVNRLAKRFEFKLSMQKGSNLGERMHSAFSEIIVSDRDKAVIIGSDSPTLPADYITEAFKMLNETDVVIGPSRDGGYYLIGMKGAPFTIFDNISWGTNQVFDQTMKSLQEQRVSYMQLDKWYDVDTKEDILYLKRQLHRMQLAGKPVPQNTLNCLNTLL